VLSAEEVPLDFVDTLIEFISVCNGPSAITLPTLSQCGVALKIYPQWLKYLSKASFIFMLWFAFALALGLFWQPLNIFGLCLLVFDS